VDLVIVESPTKAKTLSKFLGSEYKIEASFGHIRDLPKSKIGVDVDHNFEPVYVQETKQKERTTQLKKLAKDADKIYLATDPDREGEAISWHISQLLDVNPHHRRIVFHEITKHAIEDAIKHPRDLDMKLVDAQQARRVLDRLVGYKLSPLLWKKIRKGLSAGRVQSVAVRLIVEREREIEAFKPVEYWFVFADFKNGLVAQLTQIDDKKAEVGNETEARAIEADLKESRFVVQSIENKPFKRTPPAPYTTSTLQQTAANKLGWTAKRVMQVAQGLYEEGLITYHRTDSTNLADEAVLAAKQYIDKTYGDKYALETPRLYKTKSKVAQEAHEAIRPTNVELTHGDMSNRDSARLYDLIWKRFVACQMAEVTGFNAMVTVSGENKRKYLLQAKGETIEFDGWYKVTKGEVDEEAAALAQLPKISENEKLDLDKIRAEQKFTQPPARYNDASLIKTLEEMGIGRPSTYAPTISTIQDRQYVEKLEKRFSPTTIGIAVNDFLMTNFADIIDYQFTAKMEDTLDEIANGEQKWQPVIKDFYAPFSKKLDSVGDTAERVKIEVEMTGDKCPTCER
jgi:DNA topoisomerase-1